MPSYDYRCEKCGVFEAVHSMKDELKECPTCKNPIFRLISLSRQSECPDYYDEHLDAHITSWEQRRSLMKARGLMDGWSDDSDRIKNQKKQQADTLGISVNRLEEMHQRQRRGG